MDEIKEGMTEATMQVGTTSDGDLTVTIEVGGRTAIVAMSTEEARAVAARIVEVANILDEEGGQR